MFGNLYFEQKQFLYGITYMHACWHSRASHIRKPRIGGTSQAHHHSMMTCTWTITCWENRFTHYKVTESKWQSALSQNRVATRRWNELTATHGKTTNRSLFLGLAEFPRVHKDARGNHRGRRASLRGFSSSAKLYYFMFVYPSQLTLKTIPEMLRGPTCHADTDEPSAMAVAIIQHWCFTALAP